MDALAKQQKAAEYLNNNADLHAALGISPDAVLNPQQLGAGEHNQNYVFEDPATGGRFVLRINVLPQPFHKNQVAYEYAALKALEDSGCTPRPFYLDDSPDAPGRGVLVESFCEGAELDFDNLREGDLQRAAQLMADVHAQPVASDCPLFAPKDPPKVLFDECVERFKAYEGTELEDPRFTGWIRRFFKATQEAIDAAPAPSGARHIINTETLPSHFLIGNPGAFVDWERPIIGEVAQDLSFFVAPSTTFWDSSYLFPRANVQSFLETYWDCVDGRFGKDDFERRFEVYLRVSVLRSQTWFCKNAARYAKAGGHTLQRTFDKWDTYVSDEFNQMLWDECFCG